MLKRRLAGIRNVRSGARQIAAVTTALMVTGSLGHPVAGRAEAGPLGGDGGLEDLVFVTEDIALPGPGCDAISAFELGSAAGLFHGPTHDPVARLAGSSDLSRIVANAHGGNFLYILTRGDPDGGSAWAGDPDVRGGSFSMVGGLGIMPDDETLLVGSEGQAANVGPPYWVSKYRLSEITPGHVGEERGRFALDSAALEILPGADPNVAHVVTNAAVLETVDVETMRRVAAPIQMRPFSDSGFVNGERITPLEGYRYVAHAAISESGRYVFTNRLDVAELNVADVVRRTAWTVAASGAPNGGLAYNHGWTNAGLIAVHMGDRVVVYRFTPPNELTVRGSINVQPPEYDGGFGSGNGPAPSVAWSGSGSHLIAGTSTGPAGDAEFLVIRVEDGGGTLVPEMLWTACETRVGGHVNTPNDILTANGLVVPTATPSPTSSPTAVPPLRPLYLPILLKENCAPAASHADTMIVLDASTSMLEEVRPGYTKRAAAADAAERFVDLVTAGDQVGVVSFNDKASLDQTLTGDTAAIRASLSRIAIRQFTRLDLGIKRAREELAGSRRNPANRAVMIVMTDGRANPEPVASAVGEAVLAKNARIALFVIGFGRVEDLDDEALREMASRPGYYFQTPDADELAAIYEEIAGTTPCDAEHFWGRRLLVAPGIR